MKIFWKDVVGYEGCYQISSHGTVKSLSRLVNTVHNSKRRIKTKILKNKTDCFGYFVVNLCKDRIRTKTRIHRIIAKTFIPNPQNKKAVNHKNGIKTDNRIENLEWCTHSENMKHAWKTGLCDSSCSSKRVNQVGDDGKIIKVWNSMSEAGRHLGVSCQRISSCCRGKFKKTAGFKWEYQT